MQTNLVGRAVKLQNSRDQWIIEAVVHTGKCFVFLVRGGDYSFREVAAIDCEFFR